MELLLMRRVFSLLLIFGLGGVLGYSDGSYGAGSYAGLYCGDGVCSDEVVYSESCSSCTVDCGVCVVSSGSSGSGGGFGGCGVGYEFAGGVCVLVENESVVESEVVEDLEVVESEKVDGGFLSGRVVLDFERLELEGVLFYGLLILNISAVAYLVYFLIRWFVLERKGFK